MEPTHPTLLETRKASYKAPVSYVGVLTRQTGFPGQNDFILHRSQRRGQESVSDRGNALWSPRGKKVKSA